MGAKVGSEIFYEQLSKKSKEWQLVSVTFQSGQASQLAVFGSFTGREGRFDDFSMSAVEGGAQ